MLQQRGVDLVSISHASRPINFSEGEILGPADHVAEWNKPQRPEWMDMETYRQMPKTIKVREFAINIDGRDGGKQPATVLATITDSTVPQKEISDLYWQRWHCEVDIRSIKHSLQMDVLRCKTPEMVQKEIWCHMLAYNLLRGTMVEAARRNDVLPRQLSVKGTMQAVESFTPAMMAIDECERLYDAMLLTVSAHRVGNRPGRQEPRFKKRRPAWGDYMTIPRHQSRRRLAAEAKA
jgi:hypothetical protein